MRFYSLFSSLGLVAVLPSVGAAKADSARQFTSVSRHQPVIQKVIADQKLKKASFIEQNTVLRQRGGDNTKKDAIAGALVMTLIERATNRVLKSQGSNFPSQLGGCIALLFFMLSAEAVAPGLGDSIFVSLSPGAALLAKWLPVFFVPGLAMLPLAPSVGSSFEVAKVVLIAVLGYVYTLFTVGFSVLVLRSAQGDLIKESRIQTPRKGKGSTSATPTAPPKPYADETMSGLLKGTITTAVLSLAATKMGNDLATPLQTVFLCVATFATYVWGARLPSGFNKTIHPLITSTLLTLGIIHLTGMASGSSFIEVLKTYKVGSLDLMKTGAGDVLLFLLGPSVVSFAVSMYGRKKLLKENFFIVMAAMLISSGGGLFGTAAFARAIRLGGANGGMIRLSVLSRNVTTALSMAIAAILGGDISIAASVVVLTGIIGATYSRRILDAFGVSDPITRGLAIGASSQGLGVSSLVSEPDAFPFAAMSMVLTAVCATIFVSIPVIKNALIEIAIGA